MNLSEFATPVFIAKIVDFVVFVSAIVWVYRRYGIGLLETHQEAQNKVVEDAVAYRAECAAAVEAAESAVKKASGDAARMVEIATAQATRLEVDERAAAEEHVKRVLAHAGGELERERYRVRRELLEETVDRAHAQAKDLIKGELVPAKQRALIDRLVADLERARA